MTHIPWWLVMGIWVPVVLGLLVLARWGFGVPGLAMIGWWVTGVVAWTLVEYVLHRAVFHHRFKTTLGRQIHFLAHGVHHLDPWDPTRLLFPPLLGLGISAILFLLLNFFLRLDQSLVTLAGILCGYLVYDMSHYLSHHGKPKNRWGKFLKRYHLAHHHKNQDRMYGVSQPFWDIVFRTGE
jgi:sterol desaturase/sphingolipid hydroxylase (fatty acid hydroxylase superfamily)